MGVIVECLGTCWSARENFGCTWECRQSNLGITSKLWEMPGFWWIFILRSAGVIWDSPDVHKQSISLIGEYDAWISVHYYPWIILAIVFFHFAFFALLHQGPKEKCKWFKHKRRHTETITLLSNWMRSNIHGVNVIHSISHLIRSDESRKTQCINGAEMLEALLVFADYTHLANGWGWIPMLFRSICDI